MTPEEMKVFDGEPHYHEAIQLRNWDDAAKDPSAATQSIVDFMLYLEPVVNES
jgi:predicted HD phosphohydrolase